MGILIAILHYQEPSEVISMNAESLAILAIHCDKYDRIKALRPWVSYWFSRFQSTHNTVVEYGLLLLAAHLFRSSEHFSTLSKKSQINLTPGFALEWEKIEILNTMPDHVKCKSFSGQTPEKNLTLSRGFDRPDWIFARQPALQHPSSGRVPEKLSKGLYDPRVGLYVLWTDTPYCSKKVPSLS